MEPTNLDVLIVGGGFAGMAAGITLALHSVKEFTAAVDAYIDWYNAERLQLGLDGCTPMKYRDKALKTLAG
ncbi:hypothetical protein HMPREF3155_05590 [Corynebacterium sp. HMSC06D04]|uniref:IS3 family transposase n=1 Tax=unclassified Corynebacterium TaxID=2624378 RepID=UPI0008A4215E|nr:MULTISPECIES: IS3 family transposase [unclassified Corynebacterium]OFL98968.1 hypothetical protein HMPREF2724_00100 [Corynebacterium sp. HMSC071F07]OFT51349.1 hypothetical protein HMPREF3155_05590 [Corynebacterium sp. HMSC06D04]